DDGGMITSMPVSPCSSPLRQHGSAYRNYLSPHSPYAMVGQSSYHGLGAVATESLGAAVSSNCSWGALDGLDRGSCDGRPLVLYYNLEFASGTSGRATVSILSRTFS
ncbi:hypothetical protein H0E87_009953, partial [Populus deltoides]